MSEDLTYLRECLESIRDDASRAKQALGNQHETDAESYAWGILDDIYGMSRVALDRVKGMESPGSEA